MRRGPVVVVLAAVSGLLSLLLAVAVNVATGGSLPAPFARVAWLAWPAVGVLAAVGVGLAVWQVRLQDRPAPQPSAAEPSTAEPSTVDRPRRPAELPPPPAGFTGRSTDLDAVGAILARGARVVAVSGPPGAGKSTLALRLAHERRGDHPDGQLFASLRGADAPVLPAAVLSRFLAALGAPEEERRGTTDDLAARYRSYLADRRVLVLLDDARDAAQVRPLLPGGAHCLALVTSRWLLTELPAAEAYPLGALTDDDAVELLRTAAGDGRTATADRPTATATGDGRVAAEPEAVARVVRLCGGLPLALRIAGGRLRARPGWTVADLAARLEDERRRLDELRLGDLAVRSSFETSYTELSTVDRLVFRRAGAHPGAEFGGTAAAALAGLDDTTVTDALERLVDAHLVESRTAGRYRLHDLLRLFAAERLVAEETPGDRQAALVRLADRLAVEARTAADGDAWIAREGDAVPAVVHAAVEAGGYAAAWALATAAGPLMGRSADHPLRLALWNDARRAARALGDEPGEARALRGTAHAYRNAGDVARAVEPAAEAVAIVARLGDRRAEAESRRVYGEALRDLSRYEEALTELEQARALYRELGPAGEEVATLTAIGTLHNQFWQPERAVPCMERAVALLPQTSSETPVHGWALLGLGVAYKLVGQEGEAWPLVERALAVFRRQQDRYGEGYGLRERANLAERAGRSREAARDHVAALALFQSINHGTGIGLAHQGIGDDALTAGAFDRAVAEFGNAAERFLRHGDRARAGRARLKRAIALARSGRTGDARAERAAAEELLDGATHPDLAWLRDGVSELLDPPPQPAG
jgi:tetratricopeptide (TPR) repeat protein